MPMILHHIWHILGLQPYATQFSPSLELGDLGAILCSAATSDAVHHCTTHHHSMKY